MASRRCGRRIRGEFRANAQDDSADRGGSIIARTAAPQGRRPEGDHEGSRSRSRGRGARRGRARPARGERRPCSSRARGSSSAMPRRPSSRARSWCRTAGFARSARAAPSPCRRAPAACDLSGKTVMPALVNVHVHIGYEGYTTWSAHNHTPQNVLDHLQREAFYGVAATTSVGSSPTAQLLQFQQDQRAGRFAARSAPVVHARPGAARRRPRPHPARGHERAARRARSDDRRRGPRGRARHRGAGARPREDVGRRPQRHLSQARAGGRARHRRRGACAQDAGARPRHPARRPEGRPAGRRRRARAHGAAPAARRRVPRAREGDAALLGHGDRAGRSRRRCARPTRSSSRRCPRR